MKIIMAVSPRNKRFLNSLSWGWNVCISCFCGCLGQHVLQLLRQVPQMFLRGMTLRTAKSPPAVIYKTEIRLLLYDIIGIAINSCWHFHGRAHINTLTQMLRRSRSMCECSHTRAGHTGGKKQTWMEVCTNVHTHTHALTHTLPLQTSWN